MFFLGSELHAGRDLSGSSVKGKGVLNMDTSYSLGNLRPWLANGCKNAQIFVSVTLSLSITHNSIAHESRAARKFVCTL